MAVDDGFKLSDSAAVVVAVAVAVAVAVCDAKSSDFQRIEIPLALMP